MKITINKNEYLLMKKWLGIENKPIKATEIYKGTRDGFSGTNLYDKVHGKGNCLVLIKATNGHRFGGFRSVKFDRNNKNKGKADP